MEGLLQIKTLAQHHPAILKDRLQQVCVNICTEVLSYAFFLPLAVCIFVYRC